MKARIEIGMDGELIVWALLKGSDQVKLVEIDRETVSDLIESLTEDGDSEPDYEELAEMQVKMVCECIDVDWRLVDGLRRAVRTAVEPGAPFAPEQVTFTI